MTIRRSFGWPIKVAISTELASRIDVDRNAASGDTVDTANVRNLPAGSDARRVAFTDQASFLLTVPVSNTCRESDALLPLR